MTSEYLSDKATGPILVSISCITYNHAPYIRQCLDGFMMQQTNFAFEVLIHDDASTDGTTDIIKEYEAQYPDIIKPIYEEENQWVKGRRGSAVFNFPRANGKYIALCEGDDYWTDPLKLQKQVDALENNPKLVMTSHCHDVFLQKQNILQKAVENEDYNYSLNALINGIWPAQTLTVVFRRNALDKLPSISGDVALFYFLLKQGEGLRLKDNMATYRIHETGIWGGKARINRIKGAFFTRLAVYNYDKSKDAALFLLSVFKDRIPLDWYKHEKEQFKQVLVILLKHVNPFLVLKYIVVNYFFSRKVTGQ